MYNCLTDKKKGGFTLGVSNKIKGMLQLRNKKSTDLAAFLGMKPQSLANKFSRESFSAEDLIRIADFLDCDLAFILPDKQTIKLKPEDIKE